MKYLIIILVAITCLSCSKDDDCKSSTATYSIDACLTGYLFDNGSYWVYQDTATLQLDSTYVINWSHEWDGGKSGSGGCAHFTNVEIISINYNSTRRATYSESLFSDIINIAPLANYDYRLYDCSDAVPLDSLVVLNSTFYNIVQISTLDSLTTLFYKDGVGVIRRVEYNPPVDTTTYDLINYQVSLFPVPQ